MNVSNNLQGMQKIFGSQEVEGTAGKARVPGQAAGAGADEATLSSAASLASRTAADSDVRSEKVEQVRQAIAAGIYHVPSTEVAGRMIDQMLGK